MVTWRLGRVEVGEPGETPDHGNGVEVEGNVEVTLARVGEGGGKLVGTSLEDKGKTADGASGTRVTIFGRLVFWWLPVSWSCPGIQAWTDWKAGGSCRPSGSLCRSRQAVEDFCSWNFRKL